MAATIFGSKKPMITGLFRDRDNAEAAYQTVTDRGYTRDDVGLVMTDEARARHFAGTDGTPTELSSKAADGAGTDGAVADTLGAVAAAIAAAGTLIAVPGLFLVVAGPLVAALAGVSAGGTTGGILGALIGWGIPEERVKHYDDGIRDGGILMGVTPRSEEDARHIENSWKEHNGEHIIGTELGVRAGALTVSAICAVVGAGASQGAAGPVNPVTQDAHWREAFATEPYCNRPYDYNGHTPAYQPGYCACGRSSKTFDAAEPSLVRDWESVKGTS